MAVIKQPNIWERQSLALYLAKQEDNPTDSYWENVRRLFTRKDTTILIAKHDKMIVGTVEYFPALKCIDNCHVTDGYEYVMDELLDTLEGGLEGKIYVSRDCLNDTFLKRGYCPAEKVYAGEDDLLEKRL